VSTDLALRDPVDVAERLYKSGLFKDTKDAHQALAKIMAGEEYGLGAVAALNGIFVIDGKLVPGAHVLAGRVKRSGRYDYRVEAHDNTRCVLKFYDRQPVADQPSYLGESTFTFEDAKRAGLSGRQNWQRYPRNMLFARALANGVRWYCPDVTQTGQVLVAEEAADMAGEDYVPPGAQPEPIRVENVAEPEHPSDEAVRKFFEMYLASGLVVEGAGDEQHTPLRLVLATVGANNGVHDGKPTEAVEDCVRALDRGQFERVWKAVAEAGEDA
jgi:hypothetical protein